MCWSPNMPIDHLALYWQAQIVSRQDIAAKNGAISKRRLMACNLISSAVRWQDIGRMLSKARKWTRMRCHASRSIIMSADAS